MAGNFFYQILKPFKLIVLLRQNMKDGKTTSTYATELYCLPRVLALKIPPPEGM
jgi:hypothetical protein